MFGKLTKHTAEMLRHDLEAAGIPYVDASGHVADFHALRHSYITALAMSRAPVKVIQSLARHSTPVLTLGTYAHVGLYDQTAALDALPGPTPASPEAAKMSATGTDGPISNRPSLYFPYGGDGSGRIESDSGGSADMNPATSDCVSMMAETLENKGVDASCRGLSDTGRHEKTEGVGFEPTDTRNVSTVFKTVPINHSGTPPRMSGATDDRAGDEHAH